MIKKPSDPPDDYGLPLSSLKSNKATPSKITSHTPSKPLNIPTLLSPLAFTQKITTPSSSQIKPSSKLAFYTPPPWLKT